MEGQVYLRFPREVDQMLHNKYLSEAEELVLPLFQELDAEAEASFRQNAREKYHVGDEISSLFHPVWQDEARRMNAEADSTP